MLSPALLRISNMKRASLSSNGSNDESPQLSSSRRRGSLNSNGGLLDPRAGQADSEDEITIVRGARRGSLLLIPSEMFTNFSTDRQVKDAAVAREKRRQSQAAARRGSAVDILDRKMSGADLLREVATHQYTSDPTVAWEMLKTKRPVKKVIQMKRDAPIRPDHVRFVCISCTHEEPPPPVPPGDVLIVAGDFTSCGLPKEVKAFDRWLGTLKHSYKIVIAGNHECTFDELFLKSNNRDVHEITALRQALSASLSSLKLSSPRSLLSHAIYLQDDLIELFGITIYGTPWQPRVDNWAFNLNRGAALLEKWNLIPAGVDVLITHTPPLGHGDMLRNGQRMGCVELLNSVVKRIKPKYHVFGHIHEGYGCTSDGYTKFINCCLTNENLEMTNTPVIFDMPVHPHTKQHYLDNAKKVTKRLLKGKEK